jgi:SAM-dependent methyltransferase
MVLETFFSDEHGEVLERVACPCCGADDAEAHREAHDRLFGRPGKHFVVRCRTCSMRYTNPRPTFQSLGNHYPGDYFCYDPPETLRGLKKFALRAVNRGLVKRRLKMLERVTGRLTPEMRVCDVGCSYGELLAALRSQRGCDVTGVDFNPKMVAYGRRRGVPIVHGTLKDAMFEDGTFDVVTLTEYLEHESSPLSVLAECRRVTRPGGFIAIEVPLISTKTARLFGNFWSQLDLPRHLMFFTPETLGRALSDVGYEVQNVRTTPGSVGMSLLHLFGYERIGRMTATDILATALATIPMIPVLPFLHEFMFVVARAKGPALGAHRPLPRLLPAPPSSPEAASIPTSAF